MTQGNLSLNFPKEHRFRLDIRGTQTVLDFVQLCRKSSEASALSPIAGCGDLKIVHSTLISNEQWKQAGEGSLQTSDELAAEHTGECLDWQEEAGS